MEHTTAIAIADGGKCEIRTNRKRALRRLEKLKSLFPGECVCKGMENGYTCYAVPFWWVNCRKRPMPQPLSPDDMPEKPASASPTVSGQ
jgi:hypothetical protein